MSGRRRCPKSEKRIREQRLLLLILPPLPLLSYKPQVAPESASALVAGAICRLAFVPWTQVAERDDQCRRSSLSKHLPATAARVLDSQLPHGNGLDLRSDLLDPESGVGTTQFESRFSCTVVRHVRVDALK